MTGHFSVQRGNNLFTRWIGKLAKLPPESNRSEVDLVVIQNGDSEIWHRRIGNHKVVSKQWLEDGELVEKYGPIKLHFEVTVKHGQLLIHEKYVTFLGLPFPPFFTPWVNANGEDQGESILITVEVGFYPFGSVIKYHGLVTEV